MSAADNLEQAEKDGKVSYTTYGDIEQVVYAKSDTYTIANSVATTTITIDPGFIVTPDNSSNLTLPMGIFSYDGGTTYYDFYPYVNTGISGVTPTYPSVKVKPRVLSGGTVSLDFQVLATVGGGSTIPVIVNLVLLKSNFLATPTVNKPVETGSVVYSSPLPTAPNRQVVKIAKPDEFFIDMSDGTLKTYAHNQGRVPTVVAWVYDSGGVQIFPLNIHDNRGSTGYGNSIKVDSTNTYFGNNGSVSNALYKVYKEE